MIVAALGLSHQAVAIEEIGPVTSELAPYVPGALGPGVLVSYQISNSFNYTIETLKPTELGRRIRGADNCIYTYGDVPLPYFINKTCPVDPTKNKSRSVVFKRQVLKSLDENSRFKFYFTPDQRRFTVGCKMKKTVRVRVLAGDFDTYKLRCQSGRGYNDWYLSPELGILVAHTFNGDPRRELAGIQGGLFVGEVGTVLPPYKPSRLPSNGDSLIVIENGVQKVYTDFQNDGKTYQYLGQTCRTGQDVLFEWAWFTSRDCENGYTVSGQYTTDFDRSKPITAKTRFTASYVNVNSDDRKINLNISCRVIGTVRIDIGSREIDTYEFACETNRQIHTAWLAPELGRAVADEWYNKRSKQRSIRIFLSEIDEL